MKTLIHAYSLDCSSSVIRSDLSRFVIRILIDFNHEINLSFSILIPPVLIDLSLFLTLYLHPAVLNSKTISC